VYLLPLTAGLDSREIWERKGIEDYYVIQKKLLYGGSRVDNKVSKIFPQFARYIHYGITFIAYNNDKFIIFM
jgi:hypothetical protein